MASARLAFTLVGLWAICSVSSLPSSRIWGGTETVKTDFPYVSSVRLDGAHVCGGSIIGSTYILTAAHCVVENGNIVSANRLAVRVGSVNQFSGGKLVYISSIAVHPNYAGVKNDIAVLTLESALQWTDRISSVQIATTSADEPPVGSKVTVAGWGEQLSSESAYKLNSVDFTMANSETCANAYSDADSSTICLSHELKQGSCIGDAGNGAVYNNRLVAVSNFVVGACGSRYPDVFGNVAHFASWIESVLA